MQYLYIFDDYLVAVLSHDITSNSAIVNYAYSEAIRKDVQQWTRSVTNWTHLGCYVKQIKPNDPEYLYWVSKRVEEYGFKTQTVSC
jgi:hypothetical protein